MTPAAEWRHRIEQDSDIVYAAAIDGIGVLKSIDGGTSFTLKNVGLPETRTARTGSVLVNPKQPNVLYMGTEGDGVFKSMDSGESWQPFNTGLDDLVVFGLSMDPLFPNILYVATNTSVHKFSIATGN